MSHNLLAKAFARYLSKAEGNSVAYFPDGLGQDFLIAVAEQANILLNSTKDETFAVVMGDETKATSLTKVVNEFQVVSHRAHGGHDRLVVANRQFALESNLRSYKPVLNFGFPIDESSGFSIAQLASALAEEFLDRGINFDLTADLHTCLDVFRGLYERHAVSFASLWTVEWYRHVQMSCDLFERSFSTPPNLSQLRESLYKSFGLPVPDGDSYNTPSAKLPRDFSNASSQWWATQSEVEKSITSILERAALKSSRSRVSLCDTGRFLDAEIESSNSPLAVFFWLRNEYRNQVDFLLLESDFLNPRGISISSAQLELLSAEKSLEVKPKTGKHDSAFAVIVANKNSSEASLQSAVITLRAFIPELSDLAVNSETELLIFTNDSNISWVEAAKHQSRGKFDSQGQFQLDRILSEKLKSEGHYVAVVGFEALVVGADGMPKSVSARVKVLFVFQDNRERLYYLNPAKAIDDVEALILTGEISDIQLNANFKSITLLIYGNSPTYDGKPIPEFPTAGWFKVTVSTPEILEVSTQSHSVTFVREGQKGLQSPVIAAAYKEVIGSESPSLENQNSVRGAFEEYFSKLSFSRSDLLETNFHYLVGEDVEFSNPSPDYIKGFSTNNPVFQALNSSTNLDLSKTFLASPEVAEFRSAVARLDFDSRLKAGAGDAVWPSKTSWRKLFEEDLHLLNQYLEAYSAMVELARREHSQLEIFWASYPFSFSVWNLEFGNAECRAVLLSPLHPIRLAWLAGVESTLWHAPSAVQFLGVVEGWNFPYFGPGPFSDDPLVALPIDYGDDQLFLGWSMLVAVNSATYSTPISPMKIANYTGLGSSPTGFGAATASSSLRAFERLFPHLPSVSIDLAAGYQGPRLPEVDEAVVHVMGDWLKDVDFYPGGIHVLDSELRLGHPPFDLLAKELETNPKSKLSWKRYQANDALNVRSNIRLLQDSGVKLMIADNGKSLGVISSTPLKRFAVDEAASRRNTETTVLHPTLTANLGWLELTRALRAAESAESGYKITAKLSKLIISNSKSDWSIMGDGLISPTAISAIVSGSPASKLMLWEWQPPVFSASDRLINMRPFLAIARVPESLKVQIQKQVATLVTGEKAEALTGEILKTLGSKGVGLSSLLATGGTQALGAMGFYLTLKLIENVVVPGSEVLAIPIDSAQSYLKQLAGEAEGEFRDKRADILLVQIDGKAVRLSPIEIKFYGLTSNNPSTGLLPTYSDSALVSPKEQVLKSSELLKKVCERGAEALANPVSAESKLWSVAFANLIESAAKLSSFDSSDTIRETLTELFDSKLEISVEKPLVLYFKHNSITLSGTNFELTDKSSGQELQPSVLVANTSFAFDDVSAKSGIISETLSRFFEGSSNEEPANDPVPPIEKRDGDNEEGPSSEPEETKPPTGVEVGNDTFFGAQPRQPSLKPDSHSGAKFNVGMNLGDGSEVEFWPSNTKLSHLNMGVVGTLGTGKTEFLKSMIFQIRESTLATQDRPASILIFDYKNDYSDPEFLEAVGGKLIKPRKIPVNIFEVNANDADATAYYKKAQNFFNTISKIYPGIGAVQKSNLVTSITELFKAQGGEPPSLSQLLATYQAKINTSDSVTSVLENFVGLELFEDHSEKTQNFADFLGDNVVVVSLNDLGSDTKTKNAIVTVFLDLYYDHMLRTVKQPVVVKGDLKLRTLTSFLLIDEANMILSHDFEVLETILLQGRQFGYGVILASQFLNHFKTSKVEYTDALGTWMIHNMPNISGGSLGKLGISGDVDSIAAFVKQCEPHLGYWHSFQSSGFIRGTPYFELKKK